uniref:Sulfotransferase n=1 Tax=Tetraselmis chuii TaxID=63592 RepID=A0A7S1SNX7_9CHLO|mmetsp:Transcript_21750/g.38775  ORF Transcript_21750/g.38775 Transcript_21750/m.38775 type:complete len:307 (+) Transcript_21750:223-1143(+)
MEIHIASSYLFAGHRLRPCSVSRKKNGNRYWAGLSYAAVKRKAASVIDYKGIKNLELSTFHSPVAWLLARNPYVRALSLYLDKVAANCTTVRSFDCSRTIFNVNHDHGKIGRPPRNVTFEGYMEYVEVQRRKQGNLCRVPYTNHACSQLTGCHGYRGPTHILKTEQQDLWYPCMVKFLGIQAAVSTGWEKFTGSPCYHKGRSGTCDDALTLPTEKTILEMAGDGVNTTATTIKEGTVHTTSAWARLRQHYTPKAAEIVTRLYATDFAVLKYPTWDGVGEFVVDHPPLLRRPISAAVETEHTAKAGR